MFRFVLREINSRVQNSNYIFHIFWDAAKVVWALASFFVFWPGSFLSKEKKLKCCVKVEYYFSNEYLTRDAYFLRQIRRKREGYLSMKLITNFKKVRKLSKDPRITSFCLRKSKLLQVHKSLDQWFKSQIQVNEEGSKVRRIQPIPEDLRLHTVSRQILPVLVICNRTCNSPWTSKTASWTSACLNFHISDSTGGMSMFQTRNWWGDIPSGGKSH